MLNFFFYVKSDVMKFNLCYIVGKKKRCENNCGGSERLMGAIFVDESVEGWRKMVIV